MLQRGRSPVEGKTTTLKRWWNSGLLTPLSSLTSPGWVQGFLLTTSFPSMICYSTKFISSSSMSSSHQATFFTWLLKLFLALALAVFFSLRIYTNISFGLSIPWSSTTPIRTHESSREILARFFIARVWESCIVYRIELIMGSFYNS